MLFLGFVAVINLTLASHSPIKKQYMGYSKGFEGVCIQEGVRVERQEMGRELEGWYLRKSR
jgi:hypothetical protein